MAALIFVVIAFVICMTGSASRDQPYILPKKVSGLYYSPYAGPPGIDSRTGIDQTEIDNKTRFHWECPDSYFALYPPETMHGQWHTNPIIQETRPVCVQIDWEKVYKISKQ